MEVSNNKAKEYVRRIMLARMRLLCDNGFYGLLLMHVKMGLSDRYPTAFTDGKDIYFNPEFLDELSDKELEFVMNHEIMHIVLNHMERGKLYKTREEYYRAADIVVNSNILAANGGNLKSITLSKYGVSEHLAPDGKEGKDYSVEEICNLLALELATKKRDKNKPHDNHNPRGFDYHTYEKMEDDDSEYEHARWLENIKNAAEAMKRREGMIGNGSKRAGIVPCCVERMLEELRKPQTDWRTVLNEFIQQEVTDYSFMPPDRRFVDSPFFLPDYNELEDIIKDIVFFIDTSGSMSEKNITEVYSEVKGAIDQFNGKLTGWLGFFDAEVVPPVRFEDETAFSIIRPKGGGGTRFDIIFNYVAGNFEEPPVAIVILTDGYAPFPDEKIANEIPVLWLINNELVNPPWGKVTRIVSDKNVG